MKGILTICLQTAVILVTCSVSKKNFNTTIDGFDWDTALRAHNRQEDPDDVQPRHVQDESPGQYCLCSKIYDPVCASNNESYFNLCYLECRVSKAENVTVIHQGNCIPY